jgi:hypothetical protein
MNSKNAICMLKYTESDDCTYWHSLTVPLPFHDPEEARSWLEQRIGLLGDQLEECHRRSQASYVVWQGLLPLGKGETAYQEYREAEEERQRIMATPLAQDGFGNVATFEVLSIVGKTGKYELCPCIILSFDDYLKSMVPALPLHNAMDSPSI